MVSCVLVVPVFLSHVWNEQQPIYVIPINFLITGDNVHILTLYDETLLALLAYAAGG